VDSYRLIEDLSMDTKKSDLVKAVYMQLEELEGYDMIKPEGKGLAVDQHVETCPRDSRNRGVAIGSVRSCRSVLRIYSYYLAFQRKADV
jgi:hypothetical protein